MSAKLMLIGLVAAVALVAGARLVAAQPDMFTASELSRLRFVKWRAENPTPPCKPCNQW